MGNNDYQQYKIAKTISEQIEYLNKNKRVPFNCMDKDKAKDKLLEYNYINIMLSITFGLAPIFSFIYTVETPIIILGYFFPEVKNICPYLFLIIDYSFFPFHIFKWVLELYIDKFQFFTKFISN